MTRIFTTVLALLTLISFLGKSQNRYIKISTDMGDCIIKLYNETPLHRANFVRLAHNHKLDHTLFHRVIKDFMIQGGDPDSKNAQPGDALGDASLGPNIPAEFRDSLFHKKGALGAARDDTPEKSSSGSQFYLVKGKVFTDKQLDSLETNRLKAKIPAWKREVYKTIGGTPHLDNNYTVFGEVVKGLDLIDEISIVPTGENDRPVTDVRMTFSLLKKGAIRRLEKQLMKEKQ